MIMGYRTQGAGPQHSYDEDFHRDYPFAFSAVDVVFDIVTGETFSVGQLFLHVDWNCYRVDF